jgi:predicted house-cleaning NTP pyrophosphatase (Maf/HAM1 superfamily)
MVLQDYAVDTAALKAEDVFASLRLDCPERHLVVIGWNQSSPDGRALTHPSGSDTIVTHQGRLFEKPADEEDAVRSARIIRPRTIV